jgi:superfamily I DNA and/or RNA helicase
MNIKVKENESKRNKQFEVLINQKIDNLRKKLLDFTRRNPLLSTKFSDRSNSIIRIVDEVPELLLKQINQNTMRIAPLPPLEDEPKDEKTQDFHNALSEARLTDEIYLQQIDAIDQDKDDAPDLLNNAERELKDRVREKLNMPPRQTKANLSLQEHARNNHILPSFELPTINNMNEDGRHEDLEIQTLLLPDVLERRLNALHSKEKSWKDETGISVLHAAFGFLEWQEHENAKQQLTPLVLLPVEIKKERSQEGTIFSISGNDNTPESNSVLAEKLKLEFNIDLPLFTEETNLEEYFSELNSLKPRNLNWKVRRWAVIGVFPSARIAMYKDLDPSNWDFPEHDIVSSLLGGEGSQAGILPFADEYEIDEPEIEQKVPCLISDADSSQFSALVDIADGKNLALEGPPGTGKSQTIVNTIATALALNKKVLFVAEKSAALEVVRTRLEAYGLGEFTLPLQASRSTKEQIMNSIRERIEMKNPKPAPELQSKIKEFQSIRSKLSKYLTILSSKFKNTDFNVHEILGRCIYLKSYIDSLPSSLDSFNHRALSSLKKDTIEKNKTLCKEVETLLKKLSSIDQTWKIIRISNVTPFLAKDILKSSKKTSELFFELANIKSSFESYAIPQDANTQHLDEYRLCLDNLPQQVNQEDIRFIKNISSNQEIDSIQDFLAACKKWRSDELALKQVIKNDLNDFTLQVLEKLKKIALEENLNTLGDESFEESIHKKDLKVQRLQAIISFFSELEAYSKELSKLELSDAIVACEVLKDIDEKIFSKRKETLLNPDNQYVIKKAIIESQELLRHQNILSSKFRMAMIPSLEEVSTLYMIISQSGLFSIFSNEYRKSKKKFQAISFIEKYNKKEAQQNLYELFDWMQSCRKFEENILLKELLGTNFNGLETELQLYSDLFNFYDTIDTKFQGYKYENLKTFLKCGELRSNKNLPKLNSEFVIQEYEHFSFEKIKKLALKRESEKKELIENIISAKEYRDIFYSPNSIKQQDLISLSTKLEDLIRRKNELSNSRPIKDLLKEHFKGELTEINNLENAIKLAILSNQVPSSCKKSFFYILEVNLSNQLSEEINTYLEKDKDATEELDKLCKLTNTDEKTWKSNRNFLQLSEFLEKASGLEESLIAYSRLYAFREEFQKNDLDSFFSTVVNIDYSNLDNLYESLIFKALAKEVYKDFSKDISQYNGEKLSSLRLQLRIIDREIIQLSRLSLKSQLFHNANPPEGIGGVRFKASEHTENRLLKREIGKSKRFIPVRELTDRAGQALLAYKPCWMMSPLAVAQYIPNGSIKFDLVIIDEASQMTPEDSIGALVRADQAMIVGDTNQLPPTGFFKKFIEDDELDEDYVTNQESILEMANLCFKPARRLRWHYRSRHSGLIAFSNKHVYDDKLVVFPSAKEDDPEMGVSYVKVEGYYSSGTNPEEAKAMVKGILEFMLKYPNKSLGVVVLNQMQRELLTEEMNFAFRDKEYAREYREKWEQEKDGLESFFIKNLENVQGDERDVIIIGTVYGPEKPGANVMNRFGPINGVAGKRRLNVLFSRAKQRIITYSSMTSSDIRAEEDGNQGVYMLKCWLEYSATNKLEVGTVNNNKGPDSDFEVHVIEQIKNMGCIPVPQVGVKGFSIDIGIRHPEWKHGFLMGVECDGATYHSSKSARDRDRIRQEVLEGLGWKLYRIWSTDWFENPYQETQKLKVAIDNRLKELKTQR